MTKNKYLKLVLLSLITLSLLVLQVNAALTDNLLSCIDADTSLNSSTGSYNATMNGQARINTTVYKTGSGSIHLNGSKYMNWGNIPLGTEFTFSVWIYDYSKYGSDGARQPTFDRFDTPAGFPNPVTFNLLDSGDTDNIRWSLGDGTTTTTLTNSAYGNAQNSWTLFTFAKKGNVYMLYKNATLFTSWTSAAAYADDTAVDFLLGYRSDGAWGFAKRFMDTPALWSRNLTQTEITSLYNGGAGVPCSMQSSTYFLITAANIQTAQAITVFNATINGVQYTTTNGTINTGFPNNGTLLNVTASGQCASGFCNYTTNQYISFNDTNNLQVNLTYWYNVTLTQTNTVFEYATQTLQLQINHTNYSFNHYISDVSSVLIWNGTTYTATKYSFDNYTVFNVSFLTPTFTQTNNITYYWSTNLTRGNGATTQTVRFNTTSTQNVRVISIDNCSTYTTHAIDFYLRNDSSNALVMGTLGGYFEAWIASESSYKPFNLSWGTRNNFSICINPPEANYTIYSQMQYGASNFNSKTYYLNGATLNNITETINLYLTSAASVVNFNVVDENDDPVPNVYITILKYDLVTDTSTTVEIIKTASPDGDANGNILLDTQRYKFILTYNDEIVLETEDFTLSSTSYQFRITIGTEYWINYDTVYNAECYTSFNSATKQTSFTFADNTNNVVSGCLKINYLSGTLTTTLNTSCVSGSAGTIALTPSNQTRVGTYVGIGYVTIDNKVYACGNTTRYTTNTIASTFSERGLLYVMFIFIVLVMAGLYNPGVSLGLGMVALIVSWFAGLVEIGIGSGIGLLAVFVIGMWRSNT